MNQPGPWEYANLEENAKAKVKRELDYDAFESRTKSGENIIIDIVKYAGIAIIIIIIGDILSNMSGIINITSGDDSGSFNFTIGAAIGYILGILTLLFVNRLQR